MLPVTHYFVCPTLQDYAQDVEASHTACEDVHSSLQEENQPFHPLREISDVFLNVLLPHLDVQSVCRLQQVSKASLVTASRPYVQRELVCEGWGFGVKNWKAYLGDAGVPLLPLHLFDKIFAKIKEIDPYDFLKKESVFQKYTMFLVPEKVNGADYGFDVLEKLVAAPLKGKPIKITIEDDWLGDRFERKDLDQETSCRAAHWVLMRTSAKSGQKEEWIWCDSEEPSFEEDAYISKVHPGDRSGDPLEIATCQLTHMLKFEESPFWSYPFASTTLKNSAGEDQSIALGAGHIGYAINISDGYVEGLGCSVFPILNVNLEL